MVGSLIKRVMITPAFLSKIEPLSGQMQMTNRSSVLELVPPSEEKLALDHFTRLHSYKPILHWPITIIILIIVLKYLLHLHLQYNELPKKKRD